MQSRIKILVMVIGLSEAQFKKQFGEIWNFKLGSWFSELYDTKSFYQLIESILKSTRILRLEYSFKYKVFNTSAYSF